MLSLVVPVYRNEEGIGDLVAALSELDRVLGGDFEAVLVVDGSPDRSATLLAERLPMAPFRSQLVLLSRNFGSFAAIRAGLAHARGTFFAVAAADLQEPPSLILAFLEHLRSGECDVVVGARTARHDRWSQRLASALFWGLYRALVQREMPARGVDVFACNRQARDVLLALQESNSTLVGLLVWMGFRRREVPYVRLPRRHGKSSWSLARRLRYLADSVFAFSDLPMRLLTLAGLSGMALSLLLGSVVLGAKLWGLIDVPGYAATVLTVVFFGGLNSLGLGLVGEYVWRNFENSKQRPSFLVASHLVFDENEEARRLPGDSP